MSQWIIKNILSRQGEYELDIFLQWSALCRWINWPPTLALIYQNGLVSRDKIDLLSIGQLVDNVAATDEKAWTGAYMVRPAKPPYAPMGKGVFVSTVIVGKEFLGVMNNQVKLALSANSIKATCEALQQGNFWGPFMAGQVTADWSYTPLLASAGDLNTWAPQGPGSRRGFNRIMRRPLKQVIQEEEWVQKLGEWRAEIIAELGEGYNDITAMDVQNALCETDKYIRVDTGEGRPRATFQTAEGLF